MSVKRPSLVRELSSRRVPRRKVLEGLGALAVSAPALAAFGCSSGDDDAIKGSPKAAAGSTAPAVTTPPVTGPAPSSGVNTGTSGSGAAAGSAAPMTAGTAGSAGTQPSVAGSGGSSASSAGSGAMAAAGNGGAGSDAAGSAAAGSGGSGAMAMMPPDFDDAGTCSLTITDIEGPFLIEDDEVPDDISLIRSDLREGMPGVEFNLWFRLLDARKSCAPIPDALMYIWHCNASGLYSGFDGQDPTKPYSGPANATPANLDRFCRGMQTSNADGVVGFTTVYPGWYAGRPIHVHLIARFPGQTTRLITTQLYFPGDFTQQVHESEPAYMARAAMMPAGSRNPPAGAHAMPAMKHTPGLVVGTLNVIVNG